MKIDNATSLINKIADYYGKKLTPTQEATWVDELCKYPDTEVEKIYKAIIYQSKTFPKISEVSNFWGIKRTQETKREVEGKGCEKCNGSGLLPYLKWNNGWYLYFCGCTCFKGQSRCDVEQNITPKVGEVQALIKTGEAMWNANDLHHKLCQTGKSRIKDFNLAEVEAEYGKIQEARKKL